MRTVREDTPMTRLVIFSLSASLLWAQAPTGEITGAVTDSNGAVVLKVGNISEIVEVAGGAGARDG